MTDGPRAGARQPARPRSCVPPPHPPPEPLPPPARQGVFRSEVAPCKHPPAMAVAKKKPAASDRTPAAASSRNVVAEARGTAKSPPRSSAARENLKSFLGALLIFLFVRA